MMTEIDLLLRERYPYEVANYLHISMYRMRNIMDEVGINHDRQKIIRKLPIPVIKRIIDYYNSL